MSEVGRGDGGRHRWRRAGRAALPPLLVILSAITPSGCFRMVNVDPYALPPDRDVRVHLTPDAADRVAREFGTVGPRLVGRLSHANSDSLALDAWLGQIYSNASFARTRLVIPLSRADVVEVQRRELAVKRTFLASLAGAGMVALIVNRLGWLQPELGDDDDPGPPPPPEDPMLGRRRVSIRIPLFQFGR